MSISIIKYLAEIEAALSSGRLAPYRPPGGDDMAMITTYFWNMELCQALYTCLGSLEVIMQNGIHAALAIYAGRPDWYDAGLLLGFEQDAIDEAKREIRKAKRAEIARGIDPVTPGRVVAALRFGFWTSILDAGYGNSPKGPQFWTSTNGLLATAFPHAPMYYSQHRGRLHHRVNNLRLLRNRVFHYEPIWNGVLLPSSQSGQPAQIVPLAQLHTEIIEVIGWVNPVAQRTASALDPFPHVIRYGRRDVRRKLRKHLKSLGII
ncbi:MAG TPA: hypothetical protein VH482_11770 [Thermomicrobiales bacterium]|jgi:hypothetical protein